jgi:hypothetical protein
LETENLNTERIYIDGDEDEEEKEEKNTLSFLLEKINAAAIMEDFWSF